MSDLTPSATVNDGLNMPEPVSGVQTPTSKDPARFLTDKARKTEADGSKSSNGVAGFGMETDVGSQGVVAA
jgi:hypothetical protein